MTFHRILVKADSLEEVRDALLRGARIADARLVEGEKPWVAVFTEDRDAPSAARDLSARLQGAVFHLGRENAPAFDVYCRGGKLFLVGVDGPESDSDRLAAFVPADRLISGLRPIAGSPAALAAALGVPNQLALPLGEPMRIEKRRWWQFWR